MIPVNDEFKAAIYAPSRRITARVTVKLDTDLVFDEKLIKLDIIEEMTVISDKLPSNELKFTVDNSDKAFDILNPTGQYSIFAEDQEVIVEMGVEIQEGVFDIVQVGKYYLKEWKSNSGTLTTTFTARDLLDLLRKDNYKYAKLVSVNLYDLTIAVIQSTNITDYEVDPKLSSIAVSGYLPVADFRTTLQSIAIVGKCAVFADRLGKLVIKQFDTLDQSSNYIYFCGSSDLFCGTFTPTVDKDYDFKIIDYDNIYTEPEIELEKEIKTVDITVSEYISETTAVEILNTVLTIDGEKQITLEYKDAPYSETNITVENALSYTIIENGANACLLSITASSDVTIRVTGKKVKTVKTVYRLTDPVCTEGTTVTIDNPLVIDVNTARSVAEWILQEGKLRAIYDVSWRQNYALECGDVVLVEDSFNAKKESRIIKQEFTYQGYLSGRTQTKGGL